MPQLGPVSQQDAANMIANFIKKVESGDVGRQVGKKGTVDVKRTQATETIKRVIDTARDRFLNQTQEIVDSVADKPDRPFPPIQPFYGIMPYDPDGPPIVARYAVRGPTRPPAGDIGDVVALYAVMQPIDIDPTTPELGYLQTILRGGASQVDAIFGKAIGTLETALKGGHLTKQEIDSIKCVLEGYSTARDLVNEMLDLHEMMD